MSKEIITWLFFTIFAGILPIILRFIVCLMVKAPFTYPDICSEIYFFNLILAADVLRELQDVDKNNKIRNIFSNILYFFLIILSVMYGILLENNYRSDIIDYKPVYYISVVSTFFNVPISFLTRSLKGDG